jgi:PAS domain S-box-containing protein
MNSQARVWLIVGPVALAVGGGTLALVLASEHEQQQLLTSIFGLLIGWSFVAAGLIARTRRPENRTGVLLLIVGFSFFAGALGESNWSLLFSIGYVLGSIFVAAFIHTLLAYPSGRLQTRWERTVVILSYADALLANLVPFLFEGTPNEDCKDCPANAFLIVESPAAHDVATVVFEGLAVMLVILVAVTLFRRWRGSSPAARRLLGPVLLVGGGTLFLFGVSIAVSPISEVAGTVIALGAGLLFMTVPFVFLWGVLRSRLARSELGTLLADATEAPTLVETQDALREALRDPTVELVYRLDDPGGYFNADRERLRLEDVGQGRAVTEIESEGKPIAAIVHDPALLAEPELLSSVCMALRLRLEKDRSIRALRISEFRGRALLDAIPDTMFRVARDGLILDIHSHDPDNAVIPPHEMIGTNLYDITTSVLSAETTAERRRLVELAFETGMVQTHEYEVSTPLGRRYAESRIVPSGENEFVMILRDVTDARLAASRSHALLEAIPDTMFRLTRDGIYLDFHTRTPEVLAISADTIIGTSIYDIPPNRISSETIRERMALAERAFETGEVQTQEYELRTPDGRTMYSEARIVPSGEDEWVYMVRDVTATRLMEVRNQALLEALPDAVFRLTRDGVYLDFRSPDAERQGIDPESFIGTHVEDALPADISARVMEAAERAFETGAVQTVEGEMEHEGRTVYSEARVVPSGENEFVMIVRDVTDRVVQRRQIETQNLFLGAMGDATTGLLCNLHLDGRIGHDNVNLPLRDLCGYEQYEVDDRYFWEVFVAPEDRADAERVVQEVVAGKDPGEQQSHWLTKDGRELVVAWTCRLMPEITAESPKLLVSGSDVTERVEHERRIQSERDYFGALFDATPSFICVVDQQGTLGRFSLNRSLSDLAGYEGDDVAGRSFAEVFSAPEDSSAVDDAIAAAVARSETVGRETTWVTRDGRRVLVAWTVTPLPAREESQRLVISGTDVTDRRRREDEEAALTRVALAVASERPAEEVFQTVTEEVGQLLGATRADMIRFDEERDEALIVGVWDRDDTDLTELGRWMTPAHGGPTRAVWESGQTMRFEPDGPVSDHLRERLHTLGITSTVVAPVSLAGRVWGAISIWVNEGRLPAETEERIARFTSLVSTALANAETREALLASLSERKHREDEQAALRRVAVAVASEERPESVFETVAAELGRVLGADRANILRFDPETEDALVVGVWGEDQADAEMIGRRIKIDRGPYQTIRELGRPLRLDVADAELMPVLRRRLEAEGVTSVVVAPIAVSGLLWGAVAVSVTEGSLAAETEERIGPFTSLVATGLANAEAREELLASRARIVEAGDAERRRLERNLHDGAQQRLVSLSLSLRLAQAKLATDAHAADEILSGASVELALALEELRELARGIHPAVLTDRGLGPALESLADRTPVQVELEQLPADRLPPPVEAAAFYVVSEALANVTKYAEASSVTVSVAQEDGFAVVEVADDGVGGADPHGGSGLRGLSDRVAALEGRLAIVSPPGAGTKIRAEIPCGQG